jgi:hypothetical protein
LDGLDEIAPNYTDPVLQLMKTLQNLPIKKVIISTRPELGEKLESKFNKERFNLLPFTRKEQEIFLVNCWKNTSETTEVELQKFSSQLLDAINETMEDEEFTGTPLTTKLISEVYKEQTQLGIQSDKIGVATNLYELYEKFVEEKIRINNEEKIKLVTSNVQAKRLIETDKNLLMVACQKLSLPILFSPEELMKFPKNDYSKLIEKEFLMVLKYGLISGQLGSEKFIHKTFAEFLALLYLIRRLNQEDIFLFSIRVVLLEKRFQVIRKMFDSILKDPSEEFGLDIFISVFSAISQVEEFPQIFDVACSEGNSKTIDFLFFSLVKEFLDPQEVTKFQKFLTDKTSAILQYFKSSNEFDILQKISKKFGIRIVKGIIQTKFECEDGAKTDLLSFALLDGEKLVNLLKNFKENLLLDSEFISFCFFHADESGLCFIQKVLNSKSSKQKVEACKEFLEIQKSGKVDATSILNHFRDHFNNSDPENSLLLDALKVEDFEAFKMLVEFVDDLSIFPRVFSKLLQFYLNKFGDQFNVLQLLRESLSPGPVKSNQFESCLESIKILVDHFSEDSRSLLQVLLARNESGGNFLATILDPSTTEDQFNFHIRSLQDIKKLLDFEIFKKLVLNLFDELISPSHTKVFLNFEEARVIEFLDVLGLDLAQELVVPENRNISQSQDHNLIKNFYRSVLNYFDAKIGQKTSSFEQLKFKAFRQLSIDYNFASFIKLKKKQDNLNHILIDLEIFRESSDGFRFVNDRDVQVFGLAKFREVLKEAEGFKATFEFPENTEIETLAEFLCLSAVAFTSEENPENLKKVREMDQGLIQISLLARNSIGQSFFHFLVDSGFQNSLMIEFLDFLKVHFGSDFVGEILKLKNNAGLTFWSHAFANKNISSLKEIKFGEFLEEILNKLCEKRTDFVNLKKLASDLIFGRENFERNFHEELVAIGDLAKVDGEVKFSDPCFLNYFALEEFHKYLKKIHQKEETFKFCGKLWNDRENFSELCWLIEKLFAQNLEATKKALDNFAWGGEKNEAAFFLSLDILIIELKTGKNLLFEQDEDKTTFLHKFCWYDYNWSEESVKKLFNKLKELKKFLPEKIFKDFLKLRDGVFGWTFLQWIESFKKFEIPFNFLCSELGLDFVRDFFLLSGNEFLLIQGSISEITKILNLFKINFGEVFVKTFLMRKNTINENFLLRYSDYSDPENSSDLLKLFDLIFSICGADLELFNDLFY